MEGTTMDPQDGPGTRWWTWVNGHTFHTQNSNTISRCQNAKVRMLAWGCACKHIYCHFRAAFHLKFTVQILPQHFQDPVLLSRAAEMTGKWQCLHSPYAAVHGVRLPFELLLLPTTLIPVYCAIQRLFPMTFPAVVKKGKHGLCCSQGLSVLCSSTLCTQLGMAKPSSPIHPRHPMHPDLLHT